MKRFYLYILAFAFCSHSIAQKEFHVFPKDHKTKAGKTSGNGSLKNPWDLQTALSQTPETVNGGDIIWLHEGIYKGRFVSKLNSNKQNKNVLVSAYKNEKVILNGNVKSHLDAVLKVQGKQVVFKNVEITFSGDFLRNDSNASFKPIYGINHVSGINCEFVNLKVHNNPGNGIGSWNKTGGSKIIECVIFNNGYVGKNRGRGVGIYTQNSSDFLKVIKDNTIFDNYYKGIEIWSANKRADYEYVKHFLIDNNAIFNNGSPLGKAYDNLIVGTDDRNGVNIAKDITISNNIFYHNTDVFNGQIGGNAPSLTLGFHSNAPLKDVSVENNIIIGRNNALRILYVKSLQFKNNTVYSGYIHIDPSFNKKQRLWDFSNNNYSTKRKGAFRFHNETTYEINNWRKNITKDNGSQWNHLREFNAGPIISIDTMKGKLSSYRVVLFNKKEANTPVNFSQHKIKEGTTYQIKDIENDSVLKFGVINASKTIVFPMKKYNGTHKNFGVYFIDFDTKKKKVPTKKKKSFFEKLFGWF